MRHGELSGRKRSEPETRAVGRIMGPDSLPPCCESWLVEQVMLETRAIRRRAGDGSKRTAPARRR